MAICTEPSKWIYQGVPLEQPPEAYGFLYKVTCKDPNSEYFGYFYWGMKSFYSTTNRTISKKRAEEIYSGKGPRKKKERKTKESLWKSYCTSSKQVQELLKLYDFEWEIVSIFERKQELELAEISAIIDSFCDPQCLNSWIKVNIYKKNLNCK